MKKGCATYKSEWTFQPTFWIFLIVPKIRGSSAYTLVSAYSPRSVMKDEGIRILFQRSSAATFSASFNGKANSDRSTRHASIDSTASSGRLVASRRVVGAFFCAIHAEEDCAKRFGYETIIEQGTKLEKCKLLALPSLPTNILKFHPAFEASSRCVFLKIITRCLRVDTAFVVFTFPFFKFLWFLLIFYELSLASFLIGRTILLAFAANGSSSSNACKSSPCRFLPPLRT